jgi:cyclopropane-fatty-acyl-phospholipid synthase
MPLLDIANPLSWLLAGKSSPTDLWTRALLSAAGSRLEVGQCALLLPNGQARLIEGRRDPGRRVSVTVNRARAFRRLVLGGDVGFAEAYVDGDWDTPDLPGFLEFASLNERALGDAIEGHTLLRGLDRVRHRLRPNNRRGSRQNISAHYDISNSFYGAWLDASMTYSSAMFANDTQPLEAAQSTKYENLARLLQLAPGQHVLEIGCGWGAFAIIAAKSYGCRVTALTLSREQRAFAAERVRAEGLEDVIDVRLQDYRDVSGVYDRIASIEMFEAVGEAYWPVYWDVVRQRLKPGGVAALQVITIADDRFERYRRAADFIQRHIFPGGMLPSPSALRAAICAAGLTLTDEDTFGASYARTLALWRQRFEAAWPSIRAQGFDERFRRLWLYYLAYCEAGFRTAAIDVGQYRIVAPTTSGSQ